MQVGTYTTLTAAQALCQSVSGGTSGMNVPESYAGVQAPSTQCDALMQQVCSVSSSNPLQPWSDAETCCVFRSEMARVAPTLALGYELASCFDVNCAQKASATSPRQSYQPSTVGSCGSFCGNITEVIGDLNTFDKDNQEAYCGSSPSPSPSPSPLPPIIAIISTILLVALLLLNGRD
jgi:hypothetical protein